MAVTKPEVALNVIIPIGGQGTRFSKQGYRYPKPLINIVGKPMIQWLIDNLTLRPCDTLWIAVNESVDDNFQLGQLIRKSFATLDARVLGLRHQTKGASETLYIVSQSMSSEHLAKRTVSLDCDTIYWTDILEKVRAMPAGYGGCIYFMDDGDFPIYSYIKTEHEDSVEKITEIQEKTAITNKANTGAYIFPSGSQLRHWAANHLDTPLTADRLAGEYFTSQLVGCMIENGVPFAALPVEKDDFSIVGTPEQLRNFLILLKRDAAGSRAQAQKRRFCFDLDMTLVGAPVRPGDYSTCPPIERNIKLLQQLFDAGHHIIIQTARRMKTHHGNVGSVMADVAVTTFAQLARYDIPFHDIHFGKPYADVYVDDLAVNARLDTMQEVGWMLDEALEFDDAHSPQAAGMIASRDFNTIQIVNEAVIKSSKSDHILGELFFYSHMPPDLADLFPHIHNVDYIEETGNYTIHMENRHGLTFSHLLVGRSITSGRLSTLLGGLFKIHSTSSSAKSTLPISCALSERFEMHSAERKGAPSIYDNYGTKLRRRYAEHRSRYDALGPLAASLYARINEFLDTYEAENKAVRADIIHGDPVFSNAILSPDGTGVSFIDVRCQLGDVLSPEGDIHYDLAKVLQSLCGYDHVILLHADNDPRLEDMASGCVPLLDDVDARLLEGLRETFFRSIEKNYASRLHRKSLFRLTASLIFSLIPLHHPELGPVFLRMCKDTIDKANTAADT
ncbi:hypothetical protein V2A60_010393 [Cordyceps javanica]